MQTPNFATRYLKKPWPQCGSGYSDSEALCSILSSCVTIVSKGPSRSYTSRFCGAGRPLALKVWRLRAARIMFFSTEQIEHLDQHMTDVLAELQGLQLQVVAQGQSLEATSRVREHLLHGAARRVGIIKRSIENVFLLFPPSTSRPLNRDALSDVQINLHAFVMNLYGIYDNWAWAYVLRHDLETDIGGRRRIGLFIDATRNRLPAALKSYLTSTTTIDWHEKYAKSFRDALAHRIPPYIPPAEFTPEEGHRYNELESEKVDCIWNCRWERLDEVWAEQAGLGSPCFTFLHAYTEDDPPRPVLLHPQMISDGKAVAEFGHLFLKHWQEDVLPCG